MLREIQLIQIIILSIWVNFFFKSSFFLPKERKMLVYDQPLKALI